MAEVETDRSDLIARLFPAGVPALFCPPITHYDPEGALDAERTRAHMAVTAPHARCILVPGSTGDGWELSPGEVRRLLEIHARLAGELGYSILVGALHPDAAEARRAVLDRLDLFKALAGTANAERALAASRVAGFTVCGPSGADLTQGAIEDALRRILDLGLPAEVYQLPQVTKNEISPAVMERLVGEYPNLWMMKDTSGSDRVVRAGIRRRGAVFVRGAEGDFASWLADKDGESERKYDGFLLSSANTFAPYLAEMIRLVRSGDRPAAEELSGRMDAVVRAIFAEASFLPFGNPFSNANKALDHVLAWGGANRAPAPITHSGSLVPAGLLSAAEVALRRGGFLPARGYLET